MGSTHFFLVMSVISSYFSYARLDTLPPAKVKKKLLGERAFFQTGGKEPKEFIAAGCDAGEHKVEARPVYMLPADHS